MTGPGTKSPIMNGTMRHGSQVKWDLREVGLEEDDKSVGIKFGLNRLLQLHCSADKVLNAMVRGDDGLICRAVR